MNPISLPITAPAVRLVLLAGFGLLAGAPFAASQIPVAPPAPGAPVSIVPQTAPSPAPRPAASPATVSSVLPAHTADSSDGAQPVLDLLSSLAKFDQNGRDAAHKVGFELPESSVNDYIAYVLRTRPRPGVHKMHVSLMPHNQIAFEAEVDLAAIAQWLSFTPPEALKSLFSGVQTVRLNLEFESRDGTVTLKWKDAFGPGNIPVPAGILTTVLQSLGAHQPEAYDTTKPIPLPFGLQRIWTEKQSVGGET